MQKKHRTRLGFDVLIFSRSRPEWEAETLNEKERELNVDRLWSYYVNGTLDFKSRIAQSNATVF